FTMMECSSLNRRHCKETFNVFFYESPSDSASKSRPPWMENPYKKLSTVAADHLRRRGGGREAEQREDAEAGGGACGGAGPLEEAGLYLAFQSQGACMALLTVRVAFASFPETIPHSLVEQAQGVCVENAVMPPGEQARPPSMLCGEDGQWVGQPVSSCSCRPGYETGGSDVHCRDPFNPEQIESVPLGVALLQTECVFSFLLFFQRSEAPPTASVTMVTTGQTLTPPTQPAHAPLGPPPPHQSDQRVVSESGVERAIGAGGEVRPHLQGALLPLQQPGYVFTVQSLNGVSALSQSEPASGSVNVSTSRDGLRRAAASESSLTVEWNQNQSPVLDYQLRYSLQVHTHTHTHTHLRGLPVAVSVVQFFFCGVI
ncbi:hypothetical protein KUCAC02_037800, partial [Chaenocephalus aceratus]